MAALSVWSLLLFWRDLLYEFTVRDPSIAVIVVASNQRLQLTIRDKHLVFGKQLSELFASQISILVPIAVTEGVMSAEIRSPSQSLS